MNLIRIIVCLTLCLFSSFSVFAKGDDASLEHLMKQCEEARSLSQYAVLESTSSMLIDEAQKQYDTRAQTYAYFYNGLAKLFEGYGEESLKMLDKADEMANKTGNDSVRALVMNARAIYHAMMQNNNFVAQQFFFKSLDLAKKSGYEDLQYRVRGNLLTLSQTTGDSVVLSNAKEVYEYGLKSNNYEQIAMGVYYLATYYYKHENYDECEKYLKIALDTYNKYSYEDISSVYALYAKMLIGKGDLDKAEEMTKKAISLAQKYNQTSMLVDAYITYAEVLNKKQMYPESVEMVSMAMKSADEIGMTSKIIDCNELLATNYHAMGNDNEAFECMQKADSLLDAQVTINMERLSHEQQIMYEMEQKEMDAKLKQEQISTQRIVLKVLFVSVLILLILLVFIVVSSRRRHSLYKKIVLQNSRAVAREKSLLMQIDLLTREGERKREEMEKSAVEKPAVSSFSMDDDKIDNLYASLCRLMDNERLFAEAQLTREKMAERLHTNRTYLTKVIKEKTGMSYLQFVNSYRINEAIRILSDKEQTDYPLKQIWSDLGFSSPSTFFKLFQQAVGITPSTYRKQFLQVKNAENDELDDEE